MVVRVAERVGRAQAVDSVWVATDDREIARVVEAAGFEVVMTDEALSSGTDRVAAALAQRADVRPAFVVNVQGDEPLIDPDDIDRVVEEGRRFPDAITTLARKPLEPAEAADPNRVKVALTDDGRALYFSRAPIPYSALGGGATTNIHGGVYGCTPEVLRRWCAAAPSTLETAERLEQLRALELGIPIRVMMCLSPRPLIGVDVPEDVDRVEAALRALSPN